MNRTLKQQLVEKGFVSEERAELLRHKSLKSLWQQERKEENARRRKEKLRMYMSWNAVKMASRSSVPDSFFSSCVLCGQEIKGKSYYIPKTLFTFLSKRFGQRTKQLRLCEICKNPREVR